MTRGWKRSRKASGGVGVGRGSLNIQAAPGAPAEEGGELALGEGEEVTCVALVLKNKFRILKKLNCCPWGTAREQGADSEAESGCDSFPLIRPQNPTELSML